MSRFFILLFFFFSFYFLKGEIIYLKNKVGTEDDSTTLGRIIYLSTFVNETAINHNIFAILTLLSTICRPKFIPVLLELNGKASHCGNKGLSITQTLSKTNQNRFSLDFHHALTVMLPLVTRTLESPANSKQFSLPYRLFSPYIFYKATSVNT